MGWTRYLCRTGSACQQTPACQRRPASTGAALWRLTAACCCPSPGGPLLPDLPPGCLCSNLTTSTGCRSSCSARRLCSTISPQAARPTNLRAPLACVAQTLLARRPSPAAVQAPSTSSSCLLQPQQQRHSQRRHSRSQAQQLGQGLRLAAAQHAAAALHHQRGSRRPRAAQQPAASSSSPKPRRRARQQLAPKQHQQQPRALQELQHQLARRAQPRVPARGRRQPAAPA